MKRTLLFILCSLLLIISASGCIQNHKIYRTPINGLHWGMSENDVINTLNLTKNDMTRGGSDPLITITTKKKYNLYGANVNLYITFDNDLLVSIKAKIDEVDLNTVEKAITGELGEGIYDYADSSQKDVLSIVWHDTILKNKPEYFDNIKKVYMKAGISMSEESQKSLSKRSLVEYMLYLNKRSNTYRLLDIEGNIASFLNYPDKAVENLKLSK